jgi:hypothetical protein
MVCYARPASILAALGIVAYLVFGRPAGHFLDTAAIAVAVTAATAGAAVAAALVFGVFMSTRRRRAAAGGCVSCQFRCQHAMTPPPQAHTPPGAVSAGRTTAPGRSAAVFLPMPSARPAGATTSAVACAPRWPDRPVYRSGGLAAAHTRPGPHRVRERAGSSPTNP